MKVYDAHYINGQWVKAHSTLTFAVHDSTTEEVIATVPQGSAEEAEQAVLAARAAFEAWSQTPLETRCALIDKVVEGLKARAEEMAQAIAREVGMPIKLSRMVQVGGPVFNWGNAAKQARRFEWEERVGNSLVVREPVGVVSCITPWNFPLNQITLKVAPALAAGCTVVLKPSEVAPINAMILAEIIHEAGFPDGVLNLVNGAGPVVGEVLSSHPEVDMISFTGSTRAGKRVGELASQGIKRVALELGGKSASVILPDADLAAAVKGSVSACMLNSGQTCSAHTRMLVPAERFDEAKALAAAAVAKLTLGPSLDENTRLGPLVSASQRDRVIHFIELGLKEGAELVAGGPERPPMDQGYFVQPTVLAVQPHHTLAKEEIFGPVLVMLAYRDEEEAIRMANDTEFGLACYFYTRDIGRVWRVGEALEYGIVGINEGIISTAEAPFGGVKESGIGREGSLHGVEEYIEIKYMLMGGLGK